MCATGTTATPGPATPASASAPSSASGSTTRPGPSWLGCSAPPGSTVHGSRCCSPCTASTRDANVSWPAGRATPTARRSGVGNAAADQHQLDGYGWVLDAAWQLTEAGHHLYAETWRTMAGFADTVADRWREPDAGIWEVRADTAHHVHSKLMAWLALDRALRIAAHHRTSARRTTTVECRTGGAARGDRAAWLRRGRGHLHTQLRLPRHRRRTVDPAAAGLRPGRLPTRPRNHRRHHSRARRRIAVALPLPARTMTAFPASRAPSCRARSGSSRPSPAADARAEADALFRDLLALASPLGPLRRGDGPRSPISTWATTRRP